jgi:hypothetical protein
MVCIPDFFSLEVTDLRGIRYSMGMVSSSGWSQNGSEAGGSGLRTSGAGFETSPGAVWNRNTSFPQCGHTMTIGNTHTY